MKKKLSKKTKWLFVGTLLYVLLPQDIVPDYLLGIGQIDDAALLVLLAKSIRDDRKKK